MKKFTDNFFILVFGMTVSYFIGYSLGYLLKIFDISFHLVIYFLPILFLIYLNVDLENKEKIDETLFIIILGIILGLFFSDFRGFINLILDIPIGSYLLIILTYLYVIISMEFLIKRIKKVN